MAERTQNNDKTSNLPSKLQSWFANETKQQLDSWPKHRFQSFSAHVLGNFFSPIGGGRRTPASFVYKFNHVSRDRVSSRERGCCRRHDVKWCCSSSVQRTNQGVRCRVRRSAHERNQHELTSVHRRNTTSRKGPPFVPSVEVS